MSRQNAISRNESRLKSRQVFPKKTAFTHTLALKAAEKMTFYAPPETGLQKTNNRLRVCPMGSGLRHLRCVRIYEKSQPLLLWPPKSTETWMVLCRPGHVCGAENWANQENGVYYRSEKSARYFYSENGTDIQDALILQRNITHYIF